MSELTHSPPGPSHHKLEYQPHIQGLRALAVLLVIFCHAEIPGFAGGFIGVDIFFVISGYLITGLLYIEHQNTSQISILKFYARRFKRLLPALVFMLLAASLAAAVLYSPVDQITQASTAKFVPFWVSNIFFSWSELGYFQPGTSTNLFLHTWSLGVEEQFYLVWPLLLLAILKNSPESGSIKNIFIFLALTSFAISTYWLYKAPDLSFYLMPSRAWQFALGGLAFFWRMHRSSSSLPGKPSVANAVCLTSFIALLLVTFFYHESMPYPGPYALIPTIGSALLLGLLDSRQNIPGKLLSSSTPVFIGNISYSWYLWHWPVLLLGSQLHLPDETLFTILLLAISLAIAVFSFYFVEQPIRKGSFFPERPGRIIAASLVVMAATSVATLHWGKFAYERSQSPDQLVFSNYRYVASALYKDDCDDWIRSAQVKICSYGNENAENTALLIGDSIGVQWFDALAPKLVEEGWHFLVMTKSSCPLVDEDYFYDRIGRIYTVCNEWRREAINLIPTLDPDLIFLGNAATYNFTETQWTEGTRRLLTQISSLGKEILVIRPSYRLKQDGPGCLAQKEWQPKFMSSHYNCDTPVDSLQYELVFNALTNAAEGFVNVHVIDLNSLSCPNNICMASTGNTVVYRDEQHLTQIFVRSKTEAVWKKIREIIP